MPEKLITLKRIKSTTNEKPSRNRVKITENKSAQFHCDTELPRTRLMSNATTWSDQPEFGMSVCLEIIIRD